MIVAVNVTPWRCDALILTENGSEHCPLAALTEREAIERANTFLAATNSQSEPNSDSIRDVLEWLWNTVTGPVLTHLGFTETPADGRPWPRVWWLPTGPLSVLPLHAAASHRRSTDTAGQAVLERVVSSYVPTVRLLSRARRPPNTAAAADRRALVVGVNEAPDYPALRHAVTEAQAVHDQLRPTDPPLLDATATVAAVRTALPHADFAHFACHGAPADDPADSHLVLHDGALTVREIANLDLHQAQLAYLSACTTAFGGTTLLDESIHIASAFQMAGFQHVIATLWTINDRRATSVAEQVYANLAAGASPAHATHNAVRALRAKHPDHPYLWASYVHFGP